MQNVKWFKNAVIYHILIDRFAGFRSRDQWDTPRFLGGNLQGIIEKIPYLSDLGVNILWISPFYSTSAYHGYHITDYYKVDEHFGTLDDLETLIRETHKNGMRIICDFVPNHCSKEQPFFKEAQSNRYSKYYDWFYFIRWPDQYLCFLSVKDLPKINLDNAEARMHIIKSAKYWLGKGFDGFRLDHVIGPSHGFWRDFTRAIKSSYPSAVLIGEAWMMGIRRNELKTLQVKNRTWRWWRGEKSMDGLLRSYIGVLDGVLDFTVQRLIHEYLISKRYSRVMFEKLLHTHYKNFPSSDYYLPSFLDNHDMDRFLFRCGNNIEVLKEAVRLQFSLPQPPIIYYGTEQGLTQDKSIWDTPCNGDLQARQPMKWDKMNEDLYEFYKKIITDRKKDFI
ncbi:MAG: alpha-amylase family glycosyl hydrolase [Candidatus Thermoplasmatota archaeon]